MPAKQNSRSRRPTKANRKPDRSKAPAAKPPPADPNLLDLEQVLAMLKTSRQTFYRWLRAGRIKGHKLGRQWRFYRQDVEKFLKGKPPEIDLPVDISPLRAELARRIEQAGGQPPQPAGDSLVGDVVTLMIDLASQLRVSDMHIAPTTLDDGSSAGTIRFRIDGVLHEIARFDRRLVNGIVEQLKRMAACDPQERIRPQDGRAVVDVAGRTLDLRLCFMPAVMGEMATIRILDRAVVVLDLDRLELPAREREIIDKTLQTPAGLVIVTGPAGSGKTTLLYCCMNRLARPAVKAMSIEDPVEFLIPSIDQVQVNASAGLTFARALRSILRSDPDVVLVGEIRDNETLQVTMQTSLTGHMVFSTLHTDEAAGALRRMVDMGGDPFVVADASLLMIGTRLIRCLCPHCRRPAESPEFMARAERLARTGGLDWDTMAKDFHAPGGCEQCGRTGFRGRRMILETLRVSPEIGVALRRGASTEELRTIAVGEGMTTLPACGIRLAGQGTTTLSEIFRVWRG